MKLYYTLLFFCGALSTLNAQRVGIGTSTPQAKLDVTATNEGLLMPRVALTATNVMGPITTATTSEVVYNTATAGTAPNNVIPGYYYWNGSQWVRLVTSTDMDQDWMRSADDQLAMSMADNIYTMGQVGIGTNTMGAGRLTIMGNGVDLMQFQDSGGENEWHLRTQGTGNANLGFTETGVADNRLVLEAGGNVGIGLADPGQLLDVAGVVRLDPENHTGSALNRLATIDADGDLNANQNSGFAVNDAATYDISGRVIKPGSTTTIDLPGPIDGYTVISKFELYFTCNDNSIPLTIHFKRYGTSTIYAYSYTYNNGALTTATTNSVNITQNDGCNSRTITVTLNTATNELTFSVLTGGTAPGAYIHSGRTTFLRWL